MDLYNDLQQKIKELNISIKKLRETGTEYAEAEKEYKITLRQEALKLRAEKGMPVTLIQQVVYGVPDVAEKRFTTRLLHPWDFPGRSTGVGCLLEGMKLKLQLQYFGQLI